MKIPLQLPCSKCEKSVTAWVAHTDSSVEYHCDCGNDLSGVLDLNFTPGFLGLLRSEYELLVAKDYDLSIVMSATAFEWQMVFLHNKWAHIDAYSDGRDVSLQELESLWKSHRNIFDKLRATGTLLYPEGFEAFVRNTQEFHLAVSTGFPSLSIDDLSTTMHRHLFVPRNRIIHFGQSGFTEEEAVRSYNIARLGVLVLHSMDISRRAQ